MRSRGRFFRWSRSGAAFLAGAALFLLQGSAAAQAPLDCPPSYAFNGTVDYLDGDSQVQLRIRQIEGNHLNANVENLTRGQSSGIGGDLRFVLNIVPNHHRAMHALMSLALRDKTDSPPETAPFTVRCWLHRATVFNPNDGKAFLILGVYLARLGDTQNAVSQLRVADELLPNDPNVNYNLGLVFFELKNYDDALERAKRAYAAGFPLPGLRQKLQRAGKWSD